MTEKQFGTGDDSSQNTNEGTNFGDTAGENNTGATGTQGITVDELLELQTRDVAAQAHIPVLEGENAGFRERITELESQLANSTSIDDALARIANKGTDDSTQLDTGAVTQIVDRVLAQKQSETTRNSNWNQVQSDLTELYGDWPTADAKVKARSVELGMSLQDATTMAQVNPKAFLQLYVQQAPANADSSSGVRSGGAGQSVASGTVTSNTRDAAYYNDLRKKNPREYWKTSTQLQYRKDVHGET